MSRLVLALSLAGLAAGCSSGNLRLAGNPLFAASNPAAPTALAPIESAELPPPNAQSAAPVNTLASLKAKGFTTENAPIVEVGPADTLQTLATGFAVPANVILEANGLISADQVQPGKRLVIPVKAPAAPVAAAGPQTIPAGAATLGAPPTTLNQQANERRHVVQPGDTLWSISSGYGVSKEAITSLNGLPAGGSVTVGQTLRIPAPAAPVATAPAAPAPTQVASLAPTTTVPSATERVVSTDAPLIRPDAQKAPVETAAKPTKPVEAAPPSTGTGFRWPVQGRIIAGFGKQADGARNDGINLAVPAGTPVRAAESGTVIYAGNELEGYGNLILVQHANDWVSAYAHNESLSVNRGDKVSRGQTIASVGKTGSVDQPQLHFELRKKSKPVDPLPHLGGA